VTALLRRVRRRQRIGGWPQRRPQHLLALPRCSGSPTRSRWDGVVRHRHDWRRGLAFQLRATMAAAIETIVPTQDNVS
jgi:hypothetical protein